MPIITEIYWTSISSTIMRSKFFRSYSSKITTLILINTYLIIRWLPSIILTARMNCCCCYSMHLWIGNVLCYNWNSILPHKQLLIISTAYKLVLFNKIYCINCSHVLAILELLCSSIRVKLKNLFVIWTN